MIPKNERWKAVAIAVLIVAAAIMIWLRPLHLGLDLRGGTSIILEADTGGKPLESGTLEQMIGVIERRVNQLGLAESVIQRRGTDRIAVELPGYDDQESAIAALGKTAQLTMSDEHGNVIITGAELKDAILSRDNFGRPAVAVTFNPDGAAKFAEFTRANVGRPIVIRLDEEILSTAVIQEPITDGRGQISGRFTVEEAKELAALLRAGALPVPVKVIGAQTVGPSLGQASVQQSLRAAIIGVIGTLVFMLLVYRGLGVVAALALTIYGVLVAGGLMGMGAVLTLPGIAGLMLSVGMAVDGNVLIFERAKEEYKNTDNVYASIRKGYERAMTAIVDSNLTTVLAAVILFFLSTGAVRGFAVTLGIGTLASFLTAVTASRILTYILAGIGLDKRPGVLGLTTRFKSTNWNVVGRRNVCFGIFGALIIISLLAMVSRGFNYGLDFAGGTLVEVQTNRSLSLSEIEKHTKNAGISNVLIQPSQQSFSLKGKDLPREDVDRLLDSLKEENLEPRLTRQEYVGPTIGRELREKAVLALLLALLGQIIYVSVRFEWRLAVAAVGGLLNDVLLMTGLFALLQLEIDSTFVAALLTVAGYSINDTVVVYDRIRENRRLYRDAEWADLVNNAINQTVSRSMNTGLSTLIVLIALLLLGDNTLFNFSLALFTGIVVGTFSSMFLVSPLVAVWHDDKRTRPRR
ncbi:MAG: protein translocase subunit SecD [Firmicutes bacterium]|jgi:SecD/SecF fusion protein|nr:protein translocase subunit SecD [Bacillota bacterium]